MSTISTNMENAVSLDFWTDVRESLPWLQLKISRSESQLQLLYDMFGLIYRDNVQLEPAWRERYQDLSKIRLLLTRSLFQLEKCQGTDYVALDETSLEQVKVYPNLKLKVNRFHLLVQQIIGYATNAQDKMELFKQEIDTKFVAKFATPTLTMLLEEVSYLITAYDAPFHILEMLLRTG